MLFRDVDLIKFPEPWQPVEERDNWLYARQSTLQSIDLVERGGRLRGTSPVVFFSEPAKCTIRFTAAREEEGVFGERARYWWGRARNEWDAFGSRSIPSSFAGLIRLGELPKVESDMDALRAELDALVPGTRERLLEENINRLPPKEQRLMRSSIFELDAEEQIEQRRLNLQHRPTDHDVAHALPEKLHEQGHKLAERLALLDLQRRAMHSSRMTVNYSYWEDRCEAEASDDGLLARELLYDAHQAYRIDPMNAKEPYERAFEVWRRVLDRFPSLITDGEVGDDLIREARRYEYALKKHGLPFPDDFIIGAVLEERSISPPIGRYGEYRQRPLTPIAPPESPLEDLEGAPAATTPPATTPPGTHAPATPEEPSNPLRLAIRWPVDAACGAVACRPTCRSSSHATHEGEQAMPSQRRQFLREMGAGFVSLPLLSAWPAAASAAGSGPSADASGEASVGEGPNAEAPANAGADAPVDDASTAASQLRTRPPARRAPPSRKLALVTTAYYYLSHAYHIGGRFLHGYLHDGRFHFPDWGLAGMSVMQRGPGDLSGEISARHNVPLFDAPAGALTLGTGRLAVDGVLLIGERATFPNEKARLYPAG